MTTIRAMSVDDVPAVYKLGLRCYNVLDKPYNYWTLREVAHHLETNPRLCYVAEDDGRVVGLVLGEESYEVLEDTGHIEWVAVDRDYRRRGLASELITTVLRNLQELGKARAVADISTDNEASRSMASKLGFTEGISVTFFVKELPAPPSG